MTDDLDARIGTDSVKDEQIKNGNGYDHNFCINKGSAAKSKSEDNMVECAIVVGKETGIKMTVSTDQPGVQFYTGNYMDGSFCGNGKVYDQRCAFCLETQHFPDAPNHKAFPSTVLNKGDVFKSSTKYSFGTM